MRVLVAVPTFENIYPDTFKSIYDLDTAGHDVEFQYVRGYDCATARNKIARLTLDKGYDSVLMVDSDVVLPKDALQLLTDDVKDVTLGACAHRGADNLYDGRTCIYKLKDENGKNYFSFPFESSYTTDEYHELQQSGEFKIRVHGGGMGCALIMADVFNKVSYPWFDWANYKNGGVLSEDLYFCVNCGKNDIKVYADTRVTCGHLFRHVQYMD